MPDTPTPHPPTPHADNTQQRTAAVSEAVHAAALRFDRAWRAVVVPRLDEFAPAAGPTRAAVLLELALVDVERRRAAGLPARAADYLAAYPELAASPAAADALRLAEATRPAAAVPTGGAVPGYELLGEIGRGGMGVVYRALDTAFGREVAVKLVRDDYPASAAVTARFLAEARITGRLQHPGVPAAHAVGTLPDGRPFLAMKLIRGRTLAAWLADRPDPAHDRGRLVAVFEQVCHAVGYAHANGVIHRDLKPGNVMVGSFGEVQVMDWGLAKEMGNADLELRSPDADFSPIPHSSDTRPGSVLGTPAYMAPEQAVGAAALVDARSDVFGLGGILCAILTGKPPFVGADAGSTRQLAARGEVGDCFGRLDRCGAEPELVALCQRCLAPSRADRPADGGAVAEAVAGLRAAADERARRAEVDRVRADGERAKAEAEAREQRKRRRVQLALAGAVGLLLAAAAGFGWWADRQAGRERERQLRADADRAAVEARVTAGVDAAIGLAADLRRRYRFPEARATLSRVAAVLPAGDRADLRARLGAVEDELRLVTALNEVRLRRSVWVVGPDGEGQFDTAAAPAGYRSAFAAAGLDPVADPAAVGEAVARSAARAQVVAGLDDWAALEPDPGVRARTLEGARRADPGPWQDRFRDPAVRADRAAVERLVADADLAALTPGTVTALAELARAHKIDPAPLLARGLDAHPDDFLLAFDLGVRHMRTDPARAEGYFLLARAAQPTHFASLVNLGVVRERCGRPEDAVAAYRAATAADPTVAGPWHNLGALYRLLKQPDRAADAFRKALAADGTYAPAYTGLGNALADLKQYPEAVKAYHAGLAIDSTTAPTHEALGLVLEQTGDLLRAERAFEAATKADPKYARPYVLLARVREKRDDPAGAERALRAAVDAAPTFARAHNNLGVLLAGRGEFREAEDCYRRAVAADPKYARGYHNLGRLLMRRAELGEAVRVLTRAAELDPANDEYRRTLAEARRALADRTAPPPRPVRRPD